MYLHFLSQIGDLGTLILDKTGSGFKTNFIADKLLTLASTNEMEGDKTTRWSILNKPIAIVSKKTSEAKKTPGEVVACGEILRTGPGTAQAILYAKESVTGLQVGSEQQLSLKDGRSVAAVCENSCCGRIMFIEDIKRKMVKGGFGFKHCEAGSYDMIMYNNQVSSGMWGLDREGEFN